MKQLEKLQAALADFRRADAELRRIIREAPRNEAGRIEFEAALRAAAEAGDRLAAAQQQAMH